MHLKVESLIHWLLCGRPRAGTWGDHGEEQEAHLRAAPAAGPENASNSP